MCLRRLFSQTTKSSEYVMLQTLEDVIAINNKKKKMLHKKFVVARSLMDFLSWTLMWRTWSLFSSITKTQKTKTESSENTEKKHLSAKLYLETISHDSWKTNNNKESLVVSSKEQEVRRVIGPSLRWVVGSEQTGAFVSWEKKLIAFFFSKAESPCVNHWQGPT